MSNKEKTLVILTPAFPANESETNWVHSLQLLLGSLRKIFPQINILVISFIYPGATASYQWKDITVFSFNGSKYKKYKRPFLWGKIWKKLSEVNRAQKIDAILSLWCGECALVGHYFGKRNSVKHFTWICGQDARERNRVVKLIRPLPTELIAKSDFLVDEFYKNHGIKPAHLITNGIDVSMFSKLPDTKDIDIMGAGSLSFMKQYDIFLEVIAELKKNKPGIKGVLVGDGEHAEGIKKMREDLSLQENVELKGILTPEETVQLMLRSKIFLHPSSYEGFSMAILEALYAGAHVVSFVKLMNYEIKNWHIVKTKKEMIAKVNELLNAPKLDHDPVFTYSMDDSAASMVNLLGLID